MTLRRSAGESCQGKENHAVERKEQQGGRRKISLPGNFVSQMGGPFWARERKSKVCEGRRSENHDPKTWIVGD